jgi:hypothetical protein
LRQRRQGLAEVLDGRGYAVTRAAPDDVDAEGPRPRFMPMGHRLPEAALPRTLGERELRRLAPSDQRAPAVGKLSAESTAHRQRGGE